MINKWLLALALAFISLFLQAQRYPYNHFSSLDGLPSNSVRSSLIDSRDWFWVGTDAGVARYQDGGFVSDPRLDTLNGMQVWAIVEDGDNKLWFGTYGNGLASFSGDSLVWYNTQNSALADDFIRVLKYLTKYKQLLIGGSDLFAVMTKDSIQNFKLLSKYNPPHVVDFMLNKDEYYILTGDPEDFTVYNPESRKIRYIQHGLNPRNRFWAGIVTRENEIYFSVDRDSYYYKSGEKEFTRKGLGQVFEWLEDPEGNLWAAAWKAEGPGGLFRFSNGEITDFTKLLGLENASGWGLEYDTTNACLWFSTINHGIIQIPKTNFEYIDLPDDVASDENINAIQTDLNGNIWISTETKLLQYANGEFREMDNELFFRVLLKYIDDDFSDIFGFIKAHSSDRIKEVVYEQYKKNALSSANMVDFADIVLKLGFTDKTLGGEALYNSIQDKFQQFNINKYDDTHRIFFYGIQVLNTHKILISSSFGIYEYDLTKDELDYLPNRIFNLQKLHLTADSMLVHTGGYLNYISRTQYKAGKLLPLPTLSPEDLPELPQSIFAVDEAAKRLWYSSLYTGLYTSLGEEYTSLNKLYPELPQRFSAIAFDGDSLAIAGGNNGKLYVFSSNKQTPQLLKSISSQDGLKGKAIMWLQNDDHGFLWVATNEALYRIAIESLLKRDIKIEVYNTSDGYKAYTYYNATKDLNGNIWAEAAQALVKINTNPADQPPTHNIKAELHQIDLFHRPVQWNKLTKVNPWTQLPQNPVFDHDQNYFTFHYSSTNRINPQQDYYSYRLLGLDTSWSIASTEKRAVFTSLDPGNYTFELRLSKPANITQHTLSYPFVILHPWWRQWWFIVLVLAVFVAMMYVGMNWRIRFLRKQQKRKYEVQQQLAELKLQALQAQMNPHFIFNVLTTIQNAILKNEID
ncbi:MAG: histidine kinase, partial [Bacteroidales bacterium]|nr:histidine kinase [Bacteroidales bacterium]